jgi:hypothetical protein
VVVLDFFPGYPVAESSGEFIVELEAVFRVPMESYLCWESGQAEQ